MMALPTIVRKLLGDARWSLAFSVLAFFGLTLAWDWGVSVNQFPPPEADRAADRGPAPGETEDIDQEGIDDDPADAAVDEPGPDAEDDGPPRPRGRRRGMGIYIGMGVPADRMMLDPDDPPTLLMQAAMANHPLVLLTLMGWAIARASAAVAGEIERGTLDLTLSRPVRRSTYLAAQVLTTVIVFLLLAAAMVAGHQVSPLLFRLHEPPGPAGFLPSMTMVLGLGLAIFGYTLVLSSRDLSRARAGILGLGVTLAGLAAIIFSRQLEGYDWLADLSVFQHYYPVGVTADWVRERSLDLAVLFGTFAVGLMLSFLGFLTRDLPTNAG